MVVGACLSVAGLAMTLFVWIAHPITSLVGLPGPPLGGTPLYGYLHQSSTDLALSLVIVAYVAVLGPLFEEIKEIMFRGLFLGPFLRRFGVSIASAVSAALWASGHTEFCEGDGDVRPWAGLLVYLHSLGLSPSIDSSTHLK
jgi:membrane protease YdiL (CAAX protease family)